MHIFKHIRKFCTKYAELINKFSKNQLNLNKGLAMNKTDTAEGCECTPIVKNWNTSATGTRVLIDSTTLFIFIISFVTLENFIAPRNSLCPTFKYTINQTNSTNSSNHGQQQPQGVFTKALASTYRWTATGCVTLEPGQVSSRRQTTRYCQHRNASPRVT